MSHLGYLLEHKCQREFTFNKIVVRRLPPNLTLEIFKEQVSPLPPYNYIYFVPAHKKECIHSFSRAYINFVRNDDIYHFKQKYDNYVFIGPKGLEYYAVVEFAPYQEVPKNKLFQRNDNKSGTIQNNIYFKQYLENLKLTKYGNHEHSEYDFQFNIKNHNALATTPLLKYIAARKSERGKGRIERKKEIKQIRNDNCLVFVNSSVKKCGIHRSNFKKYS